MSSPAAISTLSEFLLQAHTQHMVFDLGRGIRSISNQQFFEWEKQQTPCAYPRQNHAWFCIVFWNDKLSSVRFIWFIKLPLDENGLIISAALQQFLEIIAQALGKQLQHSSDTQAQLPENPYVFTPSQQQLALCNALIRKSLDIKHDLGQDFTSYMQAPDLVGDELAWEKISVQQVADFVIYPCLSSDETLQDESPLVSSNNEYPQSIIARNLQRYAPAVQNCLLSSLEAVEVKQLLGNTLIDFHQFCLQSNNTTMAALCLRAMSFAPSEACTDYIVNLINSTSIINSPDIANDTPESVNNTDITTANTLDLETCVVIAGRYWQLLNDEKLLSVFMHQVAIADNTHQLFKGLYADLVKVPATRNALLKFIRHPERSSAVSQAIGALFASSPHPKPAK